MKINRKSFLKSLTGLFIAPKILADFKIKKQTKIENNKMHNFYKSSSNVTSDSYFLKDYCTGTYFDDK